MQFKPRPRHFARGLEGFGRDAALVEAVSRWESEALVMLDLATMVEEVTRRLRPEREALARRVEGSWTVEECQVALARLTGQRGGNVVDTPAAAWLGLPGLDPAFSRAIRDVAADEAAVGQARGEIAAAAARQAYGAMELADLLPAGSERLIDGATNPAGREASPASPQGFDGSGGVRPHWFRFLPDVETDEDLLNGIVRWEGVDLTLFRMTRGELRQDVDRAARALVARVETLHRPEEVALAREAHRTGVEGEGEDVAWIGGIADLDADIRAAFEALMEVYARARPTPERLRDLRADRTAADRALLAEAVGEWRMAEIVAARRAAWCFRPKAAP